MAVTNKVLCLIIVLHALSQCVNMFQMNKDEYLRLRSNMIYKEYQMQIGSKMKLSDAELQVNDKLMKLKAKELDIAYRNVTDFPPAVHFFRAKALIDKSEVFKMVRNIPKGKLTLLYMHIASGSYYKRVMLLTVLHRLPPSTTPDKCRYYKFYVTCKVSGQGNFE